MAFYIKEQWESLVYSAFALLRFLRVPAHTPSVPVYMETVWVVSATFFYRIDQGLPGRGGVTAGPRNSCEFIVIFVEL